MKHKIKAWFWFIVAFGTMMLIESGILSKWFWIVTLGSCIPLLFAIFDYDKKD